MSIEGNIVAAYIEKRGWVQNRSVDEIGRVCLLAAMSHTLQGEAYWKLFDDIINRISKENFINISDWNDAHKRTKEEVLALLRS